MLVPFFIGVALQSGRVLDLPALIHAPEAKVESALGPKHTESHLPFILFHPAGTREVRIDSFGPKMKYVQVTFASKLGWAKSLKAVGLSTSGVNAKLSAPLNIPIRVKQGEAVLNGVKGLPGGKWKVQYDEIAIHNPSRTKALKAKIQAATGPEKIRLIQSCYDWYSELYFDNR